MSEGGGTNGGRLWEAVRAVPRTLREDLCTVARDPLPSLRWLGRLPHAHAVLFAVLMGLANANQYEPQLEPATTSAATAAAATAGAMAVTLLVVLQSGAAILALSRPVPAWWLSTLALFLARTVGETKVSHAPLWSWSLPGIALHTFVLFLLALRVRPRVAAEALGLTLLAGLAAWAFAAPAQQPSLLQDAVTCTTAVVVGASLRGRRVARTQLVEQEVRTADERARRTLLEERNRIARELHDVVAHHMSVISIQAQVAPHLVKEPTDELKENLAGIRENAVEALTELRRVLGVLRSEDAPSDGVRHAPQPTLGRLDELVGKVRATGLAVVTETTGATASAAAGSRPVGVPHRPGGAQQHDAARARSGGAGGPRVPARRAHPACHQHRAGPARPALAGRRPRIAGHARAHRHARRRTGHRPHPRRRLRGDRDPSHAHRRACRTR